MSIRLGCSVGDTNGLVYDRKCGSGYTIECAEAQINADLPTQFQPFLWKLNRRSYGSAGQPWPTNQDNQLGRPARDAAAGRIIFSSWKSTVSWQQTAAGAIDSLIDLRGDNLNAFWDLYPDTLMFWSPHHEPNGNDIAAEGGGDENLAAQRWRDMCERWWERWLARGIPVADVTQAGQVLTPGIVLCGPILVGGAYSGAPGPYVNDPDSTTGIIGKYNLWMPQSWTWGWENCRAVGGDGYNQGPVFRAFEEVFGALATGTGARPGFRVWANARQDEQNALGRSLQQTWWEFGCRGENDGYGSGPSPYWTSLGLPMTKQAWLNWLPEGLIRIGADSDQPHPVFGMTYFDSAIGGNAGSGWQFDTSVAHYQQGLLPMLQHDLFAFGPQVDPPDPPGPFTPGAFPLAARLRMSA